MIQALTNELVLNDMSKFKCYAILSTIIFLYSSIMCFRVDYQRKSTGNSG